jgi:membrane protein YdbS with pleckstrin-like domain
MRLSTVIVILTAALGAVGLWAFHANGPEISAGVKAIAAVGAIRVIWMVGAWLRNRRRRQLMDLRDSALW